ncbi:MAG: glutathione S-transferase family protein [Steroidobacteraceae bacterium]
MKLYIANKNYSSWSLRPWVLMRELGIPFEEHLEPFGEDPHEMQVRFGRFSPSAKVPCLHDGELRIWDSLAIVEHLAERHPTIWPSDPAARAYARSAAAEMHSSFNALRRHCSMTCGQRVVLRERPLDLQADLARLKAVWTMGLSSFGGPFLAGKTFCAVDAFYAPVAFRLQTYGISLDAPCDAYAATLRALPAMREWYAAALIEPWRERVHEESIRVVAESITDLRKTS